MAKLFIKGNPLGNVQGVLFDKDGTLSNSENHLMQLAELRIQQAVNFFQNNNSHILEVLIQICTKLHNISVKIRM